MLHRETTPKAQGTTESLLGICYLYPGHANSYYYALSFTWGLYKYLPSSHVRGFKGSEALPSAVEHRGQQMRPLSFHTDYSSIIQDGSLPTARKPCRARVRAREGLTIWIVPALPSFHFFAFRYFHKSFNFVSSNFFIKVLHAMCVRIT